MNANRGPLRRLGCSPILFAALVLATPAPAVSGGGPTDPPEAGPAARMTVTGRVLDPQGKPVPNASVLVYARSTMRRGLIYSPERFYPNEIGRATTDGSGRFRIDAPRTSTSSHDEFGAVALAPGYGAGWAALDPDADQPAADISLRTEQVIQGRLFDLLGQPARDVKLSVTAIRRVIPGRPNRRREEFEGPYFWWAHPDDRPGWPRPMTSAADGRFTLHGVGPGLRVFLAVHDPRFANQMLAVDTDAASAAKPLSLALQAARTITGRVTYADTGKPAPHARVAITGFDQAQDGVGPRPVVAEADADGRFRADVGRGDRGAVSAAPPSGQPYLIASERITWPKGAIAQAVDLALPRGTTIRGKVIEQGSGRAVVGALVMYIAHTPDDSRGFRRGEPAETVADGSFEMAVEPHPGYLIVRAPTEDYVLKEVGYDLIYEGKPGGERAYVHAFAACDPRPAGEGLDVPIVLRRGVTLKGRVLAPDGGPVQDAWIIGRINFGRMLAPIRSGYGDMHDNARNGRFELHGLDADTEVPVHFLDPEHKLGATVPVSGRSAATEPIAVRLGPCGTASARLVGPDGKPVVGLSRPGLIAMVVAPGVVPGARAQKEGALFADLRLLPQLDSINYPKPPVSDAQGRIVFPALIPGATYQIIDYAPRGDPAGPQIRKEFTVKPGETLDLGDIRIEKPPTP
jgi:hypothetical protein